MAICWKCSACERGLSIASRKAGTEIECPCCHQPQTVPDISTVVPEPGSDFDGLAPLSPPGGTTGRRWPAMLLMHAVVTLTVVTVVIASVRLANRAPANRSAQPIEPAVQESAVAASRAVAATTNPEPVPALPSPEPTPMPSSDVPDQPLTNQATFAEAAEPQASDQPAPDRPELAGAVRPVAPMPAVAARERPRWSAAELKDQLSRVPELDFYAEVDQFRKQLAEAAADKATQAAADPAAGRNLARDAALRAQAAAAAPQFNQRVNDVLFKKAKSEGLPYRLGTAAHVDLNTARTMGHISTTLRSRGFVSNPAAQLRRPVAPSENSDKPPVQQLQEWCDANKIEKYSGGLSTLLQMLQVEEVDCRLVLVRELAKLNTPGSTTVLARLAVFDTDSDVRGACLDVLKKRRPEHYRKVFLEGLRYPWSPVADHAADALVTLQDRTAADQLAKLVDLPDPARPVLEAGKNTYVVHELVRINHMRNCYLCHAASQRTAFTGVVPGRDTLTMLADEPCRGLVPRWRQPLPVLYYAGQVGDFVRADITYLRQDFSVPQYVKDADPWPHTQRYDYVVRCRKATNEEVTAMQSQSADSTYPQREAVRYALRQLSTTTPASTGDAPAP